MSTFKGYMRDVAKRGLNYTEAEIELLFEVVFRPLNFTPDVCQWMQTVLQKEHEEKSGEHLGRLDALQARHKMLERYMDKTYDDKLSGAITEDYWRSQHNKWSQERDQLQRQIEAMCSNKSDYMERGVLLIELAQRTEHIYKNEEPRTRTEIGK